MKKIFLLFLLFVAIPSQAKYAGGSGTSENPYLISTADQFITFSLSQDVSDSRTYVKLINDIDLNGYTNFYSAEYKDYFETKTSYGIIPILKANINGDNYTISNYEIVVNDATTNKTCTGFIGISLGKITNLNVSGNVSGEDCTGGLVGIANGNSDNFLTGDINNCSSSGNISGGNSTGGLIGSASARVINCYNTGNVSGGNSTGGLIGNYSGIVDNCYNTGNVSGENSTGGLIGSLFGWSFSGFGWSGGLVGSCYTKCEINGADNTGGLVGYNTGGGVFACHAEGVVSGQDSVGGLLGFAGSYVNLDSHIERSYTLMDISGQDSVGGLVGQNYGIIDQCYSYSKVTGKNNKAAFCGINYKEILNSFWNKSLSSATGINSPDGSIDGASGITTLKFKKAISFEFWNFDYTWIMTKQRPILKDTRPIIACLDNDQYIDAVTLNWNALDQALSYEVEIVENGNTNIQSAAQTTIEINNLEENTKYSFRSRAIYLDDVPGEYSYPYDIETIPEPTHILAVFIAALFAIRR